MRKLSEEKGDSFLKENQAAKYIVCKIIDGKERYYDSLQKPLTSNPVKIECSFSGLETALNVFLKKHYRQFLIQINTAKFKGFKFYSRLKRKYPRKYLPGYEVQLNCPIEVLYEILNHIGFGVLMIVDGEDVIWGIYPLEKIKRKGWCSVDKK